MKYLKITSPDIENGPGCRVTLWIPGCTHKCPGCHNAWTADYNQGQEFDEDAYNELKSILDKPYIRGLTISGGDPMDQDDQTLIDLIQLCFDISLEYPTKDIWLYTGYTWEQIFPTVCLDMFNVNNVYRKATVEMCDVLVDGLYIEAE